MAGADTIVHCATTNGAADVAVTRTLVDAARRAGTPHLVFISIVGVDRIPLGYYRAKLAAERVVEDAGRGWTILRATQFHDLVARLWRVQRRSPVTVSPAGTSIQPIDVRDVARGSSSSPPAHPPDGSRTSGDRRSATPVTWPGRTCERRGAVVRSFPSGSPAPSRQPIAGATT